MNGAPFTAGQIEAIRQIAARAVIEMLEGFDARAEREFDARFAAAMPSLPESPDRHASGFDMIGAAR